MTRTQVYWICQVVGWTLLISVSAFIRGFRAGFSVDLFVNRGLMVLFGIAITHLFREYIRSAGWKALSPRRLVPRVLGAPLVLAVAYHGLFSGLYAAGVYDPVPSVSPEKFWNAAQQVQSVFGISTVFFLWTAIYFGLHYFRNYREAEVEKWKLEAQAETARLKALKLQLNPHFFFNSLNSVRALIAEDPERAQKMVTRLARLLRSTLQVDDVKTVPLREELSTVRTYLELEKVRFEERLQCEMEIGDDALDRPVPFLLVQTLVENGIKHGIAKRQGGGTISVAADVREGILYIRVTNPGTLDSEDGGVGLENARERLRLLFGENALLRLENTDPDTVEATAVLPDREQGRDTARSSAPQAVRAMMAE